MRLISDFLKFTKRRVKLVKDLAEANLTPETAEVDITGPKLQFRINVEQRAAWRLYVELNTRTTTQELAGTRGLLRGALDSLHAVFGITRGILKEAGPAVAQTPESLGFYAMEILNQVIRPVLDVWHPALSDWEQQRDPKVSSVQHERSWERAQELRDELTEARKAILKYCEALAILAGVSTETKGVERRGKAKGVRELPPQGRAKGRR